LCAAFSVASLLKGRETRIKKKSVMLFTSLGRWLHLVLNYQLKNTPSTYALFPHTVTAAVLSDPQRTRSSFVRPSAEKKGLIMGLIEKEKRNIFLEYCEMGTITFSLSSPSLASHPTPHSLPFPPKYFNIWKSIINA